MASMDGKLESWTVWATSSSVSSNHLSSCDVVLSPSLVVSPTGVVTSVLTTSSVSMVGGTVVTSAIFSGVVSRLIGVAFVVDGDWVVVEDLKETGDWPLYQTGRVLVRMGREKVWTRINRLRNLS
jgi:hypothetical protein